MAANKLMALSGVDAMVPVSETKANIHVVTWKTPEAEAAGMAKFIVENIHAHPKDRHLAMVTRRRFGYSLRDRTFDLDPELRLDLGFSEGLLDSWAAREAFLMFCLLIDPDRPTWRAWLGYRNSTTGKDCTPPKRNADAYLKLLASANDAITEDVIAALAVEQRGESRGAGGTTIWDRAKRSIDLRSKLDWSGEDATGFIKTLFDPEHWIEMTTPKRSWKVRSWICSYSKRRPSCSSRRSRSAGRRRFPRSISAGSPNVCGTRSQPTNRSRPTNRQTFR